METPYYQDNHNTIYCVDFRKNELPDECVQMICTSPPYWGLRKYSGEQELIWGDNNCEHQWVDKEHKDTRGVKGSNLTGRIPYKEGEARINYKDGFCSLCGAWKGAYGLEPTPEMYVQHTIEILREIRRVLRKDGVVFWNIGDSYATHASGGKGYAHNFRAPEVAEREGIDQPKPTAKSIGLKEKDLCLIPFRIAIAAQEDGWWVRSIIIWSKPNPMPESVKDRPTESHEYILMLTKSAKYYWDQEAVRLPAKPNADGRVAVRPSGDSRTRDKEHWGVPHETEQVVRSYERICGPNLRTVWEFPTKPGPGKEIRNFAVFPEKLPEICIKAATPEVGCCAKCSAPLSRVLEKKPSQFNIRVRDAKAGRATPEEGYKATPEEIERYPGNHPDPGFSKTIGWQPTCKCNATRVPSLVLDPLMGAGTTLLVAKNLNRYAVGYELSEEYCQLTVERCRQQVLI